MDARRRVVFIVGLAAMVVTFGLMIRIASAPSMVLLYAGLEDGAAGEVVTALDQRGVTYEVRGNALFVEAGQRDQLRVTLATEGLPANSDKGYELLDNLNGFGTTSQMFDAAYWRAKEVELARTIAKSPAVVQARVHISQMSSVPFTRGAEPSASVALVANQDIGPEQAEAFQHLVASAVGGLSVENVTVIDSTGQILSVSKDSGAPQGTDRASMLRDRVERLIEARVGPGNAVVEVSVETVTETEEIRERRFDPSGRIAISTDTEERSNTSTSASDGVTVASNLPDGDAASDTTSTGETRETRERINYEVSETEREIIRAAGATKRLTVAVLVNGVISTDASGEAVYSNRSEDELNVLRELIASAVGFDEERGDVITIHSLELPSEKASGSVVSSSWLDSFFIDLAALLKLAFLAVAAMILGLFVVRPMFAQASQDAAIALPSPNSDEPQSLIAPVANSEALAFEPTDVYSPSADTEFQAGLSDRNEPVARLRDLISTRREETVDLLSEWLDEKERT